jgi:outer membrane lipoprotein-sorting protein
MAQFPLITIRDAETKTLNVIKVIRFAGIFWVVLFALVLDGCISATATKHIQSASELDRSEKDRAIVFGQIEWIENGEKKKVGEDIVLEPHMLNLDDESITIGLLGEDGKFVWYLPAGTYFIKTIVIELRGYNVLPKVAFSVPENGKAYYLGTLKCNLIVKSSFPVVSGTFRYKINDEGDSEITSFQNQYNYPFDKIEISLMVHEPTLPDSVESALERDRAVQTINTILMGIPK